MRQSSSDSMRWASSTSAWSLKTTAASWSLKTTARQPPRCGSRLQTPCACTRSPARASARRGQPRTTPGNSRGKPPPSGPSLRTARAPSRHDIQSFACPLFLGFALPHRLAFLQKGREPFLEIGRAANARILKNGAFQIVIHARRRRGNQKVFGTSEAAGACGDQQVRKFISAFHQALGRNNLRYQAEFFRLFRFDDAAGKQ